MNQLSLYKEIQSSFFNKEGNKEYKLNNGSTIIHVPKLLSRKEAEVMLENHINNLGAVNVSYHFSKGLIFKDPTSNMEIPLKSMERTLDRFDRLRNYEIEVLFLQYFDETFLINETCPFNGFITFSKD